jgi:hypothetical protein
MSEPKGKEKSRLLTEAVSVTGYNRKAVIGQDHSGEPGRAAGVAVRPVRDDATPVVRALKAIPGAAGYVWSAQLKALLPLWQAVDAKMAVVGTWGPKPACAISPRQIESSAPERRRRRRRLYGRTTPGTPLKHHIPLKDGPLGRSRAGLQQGGLGESCRRVRKR